MKYRVVDEKGQTRAEGEIAESGLAALLRDTPADWKIVTEARTERTEEGDVVKRLNELAAALAAQANQRRGVTFVLDLGLDRAFEKLLAKMDQPEPPSPGFSGGMSWGK